MANRSDSGIAAYAPPADAEEGFCPSAFCFSDFCASAFDESAFCASAFGASARWTSTFGASAFDESAFGASAFDASDFGASAFCTSACAPSAPFAAFTLALLLGWRTTIIRAGDGATAIGKTGVGYVCVAGCTGTRRCTTLGAAAAAFGAAVTATGWGTRRPWADAGRPAASMPKRTNATLRPIPAPTRRYRPAYRSRSSNQGFTVDDLC